MTAPLLHTVSSRWLRSLLDQLRQHGVDVESWLAGHGYSPQVLEQERVPFAMERLLFRDLPARIPELAILLASSMSAETLPRFHFALASCATLGEAFGVLIRMSPLLSTGVRFVRTRREDLLELSLIQVAPGDEILPAYAEFTALRVVHLAERATAAPGGRGVEPVQVWLRHHAERCSPELRARWGERLLTSRMRDAVLFRLADLERPCVGAEPRLGQILAEAITVDLAALPAPSPVERVHAEVAVALSFAVPLAEDIARQLGVSERTMGRQLAEAGTSFTDILQSIRMERARSWLAGGETVAAVAELVHYSEVAPFWRAYRRHFGHAPGRVATDGMSDASTDAPTDAPTDAAIDPGPEGDPDGEPCRPDPSELA